MDENNVLVIEAVEHNGAPLVLTLKAYDWFDTYSVWVPRPAPICIHCGQVMKLDATYPDRLFPERWRCPSCHVIDNCVPGDYGEMQVKISAEEWNQRAFVRSQRDLLHQRYGRRVPSSIRDYWMPKGEQDDGQQQP